MIMGGLNIMEEPHGSLNTIFGEQDVKGKIEQSKWKKEIQVRPQ